MKNDKKINSFEIIFRYKVFLFFKSDNFLFFSSDGWVDGNLLDTTDTNTSYCSNLDVSLVTPRGTPRVSNDVIVFSIFGSITNGCYSVVKSCSTSSAVENTTRV